MNLVILHGPPASGKHTVGQKLSEVIGYKFFYNHLTVDVVRVLFDDNDDRRRELLSKLRLDTIDEAGRYDMDMIFTMAYTDDEPSQQFVQDIERVMAKYNGTLHYVLLNPPESTLYERIGNDSRKLLHKPTDPDHLRHELETHEMRKYLNPATLELDTSKLTPEESARQIIKTFGLE